MGTIKLLYRCFLAVTVSVIIWGGCVQAERDNPDDYIQNGCTLSYDSNGAESGVLPAEPYIYRYGRNVAVKGNSGNLAKKDYQFAYWSASKDGSGKCYMEGDPVTISSDITLYAQWGRSDGLMYVYEDYSNSYSVGYKGTPRGIVIIPSQYNGLSVTAITSLMGCDLITGIVIPETVTYITNNAGAFAYCTGLQNIYVSNENNLFTSEDGILFTKDKKTLVLYPAGRINSSYTIPAGVTSVTNHAFTYCRSLVSFSVESTNTSITSIDGVLFSIDKKTIICYPRYKEGQSYKIPDETTTIAATAFNYCMKLLTVTLPDGLESIGAYAFENCSFIEITIPENVTTIGKCAFFSCDNLETIKMLGSNPPVLGSSAFNSISLSAKIKVPSAALGNYKAAPGWSVYEEIIEGY